ncbi:MAG: undecaprenyl-diphosphatase [Candidatus Melainabacteria bacterium HGW-Melainabacteria-1]|nr:MAG: undecaprenyl-diphosphatase [Candidatus Melainabacteria bacterium HGW-Melainabacteria-1]
MKPFRAIVLGAVQGLTEFLPVSSTAHLNLAQRLLGWQSPGMVLDTSLHLGTLLATGAWLVDQEQQQPILSLPLLAKVALATLPAGLAGLLLEGWIERHLRRPELTASMLILGAGLLWLAERQGRHSSSLAELSWSQAVGIGLAQALALIPGLSRSGATMSAGLAAGLQRPDAVRFSYLLSVPVVAASGLFKLKDLARHPHSLIGPLLWGGLSAAVFGFVTLEWLLQHVRHHSLKPFVLHRLLLGGLILASHNLAAPAKNLPATR